MLEELRIRGLGVIEDAALRLAPGLTAVTGETGAGKTMVVTGLLLLFGGRADAARVRSGAGEAVVDGRLRLPEGAAAGARVRDAGGAVDEDGTLVLRRVVTAAGRSRAYAGGAPTPVSVLAELADGLLAVHGQADQARLARPADQRAALDRFAGIDLADYRAAYTRWRSAAARLAERQARLGELRQEADLLAFGLAEIEAAEPQPGEDAELAALAGRLAHADALRLAARAAHDALLGDPDDPASDAADVMGLLGQARRWLAQQDGDDPRLDALAGRLGELAAVVSDLGAELAGYPDELAADPGRLAEIEQRRALLGGLVRKYAAAPVDGTAGVLAWADRARNRLTELDVSDEATAALVAEVEAAAAATVELAATVSLARGSAAERLAEAVSAELAELAMPTARVSIAVRPRPPNAAAAVLPAAGQDLVVGPDGADEVEFLLQPHPGAPALPLGRGASGGELSRVMLALEVCLRESSPVPTLIFDEVDAGVGGRAAVEVGRRLARLARDHQVVVVTHLPQVAAFADHHVVVDRSEQVAISDVREVTGEARTVELARMLAGTESGTARRHARELLAAADEDRDSRNAP